MLPGFGIDSPRGPEWDAMHLDPATRGRRRTRRWRSFTLWKGEKRDLRWEASRSTGASTSSLPVQADFPMWIGGSSDAAIRRTASYGTGWQAGPETPETVGQVIAAIKRAVTEAVRSIDDDHHGAAFASALAPRTTPAWRSDGASRPAPARRAATSPLATPTRSSSASPAISRTTPASRSWRRRMGTRTWTRRPGGWSKRCPRMTERWPRPGKSPG